MSNIDRSRAKLSIVRDKLLTLSSELGMLKCDFADEGADEAYHEIEQAQDAVDSALSSIRAAFQYSREED